jgi:hypothetical protein
MATRKQRRRREKDRRHEYEFVYYDEEGREVEVEKPERPEKPAAAGRAASKAAPRNGRATRPGRVPKPPTWRSVGRIGVLMFALLFLFSALLVKAPAKVLLGTSKVAPATQTVAPGTIRAFRLPAGASGTLSSLSVYVDKRSQATKLVAGLYADGGNRPGKLLVQESGTPSGGKWNSLGVSSKGAPKLVKDRSYWLAVLGTGGRLVTRDTGALSGARQAPGASATSLAPRWSGGTILTGAGFPSAYAGATGSVGIGQRLLLPVIYTLILMPSIYLMQRLTYRGYLKRTGQLQQKPRKRG